MPVTTFTHLHLHTEYSLLDGAIRLRDLPDRLAELGMQACAITDHGAMYGVIDFYNAMLAKQLKPILGCEVYVAPRSHLDKEAGTDKEPAHLILLAENNVGYRNLMKLVSLGFIEGFYYRPRIDHELLERYSDGLICLSACLGGEIPQAVLQQDHERARALALEMDRIFGRGNFFLELQYNRIPQQTLVNSALIRLSQETGIPLVATNDCHYLRKEDAKAHEVLLCMQTGKRMSDDDRMRMETDEFYVKAPEEMAEAFADVPEALANTARIADRCQVILEFHKTHLPHFDVPEGQTHEEYLGRLCLDGLNRRLELPRNLPRQEYERRLDYELSVINQMGFTDYYLIVWDFIRFANSQNIMVGPGRGSGAGSLAAYCLGITNIDPLQYALIFERFLNAERVSMPDFDIDFCYERRQEVIDYVTAKYGQDRVAQVITFGTLAARACIRDVARALDVSYAETDRLAKMIPATLGITISKALETNPELRADYEKNEMTREILDMAVRFEGMPRHASTHAAGVIISSMPLTDIAPLSRNEDAIVVQFAKNNVELIGLLKFDFLGLRTLTVLRDTAAMVWQNHREKIDYDRLPIDDQSVYAMINEGNTEAVFQLESSGMTSFMKELHPESLEDIIAGIALYRPGPMEQIPRYVAAKHDPNKIRYDHPLLEPILNVTYGCIVYQEQVMQIVRDLAGFSMGQSDNVRRAMSKKKPSELAKYKNLFLHGGVDEKNNRVPGAVARGVSLDIAEKIFDEVMAFAGYAFNKSHAAAYAVVAYQTAWLKVHYPVEFMAAMLNSYLGSLSQAAWYVRVCRKMGIAVLPPDINLSDTRFTTENGSIRFSLAAVKNVGEAAIRTVIRERCESGPFKTYGDFLRRLSEGDLNRKMVESLIRASALDCFQIPRSHLIAVLEPFSAQIANGRRQSMEGQLSFFELGAMPETSAPEPEYPALQEFSHTELLGMEKEMLGLYVTGHPLDEYEEAIRLLTTLDCSAFANLNDNPDEELHQTAVSDGDKAIMAGMLIGRKNKATRSNELMSFLTVEDLYGQYEVIAFPRVLSNSQAFLQEGQVLIFGGRLSIREDDVPKLIAEAIAVLDPKDRRLPAGFDPRGGQNRSGGYQSRGNRQEYKERAAGQTGRQETSAAAPAKKEENRTGAPTLCIRYFGRTDDDGYQQLLAMLQYFSGSVPVRVYLPQETRQINLPPMYHIELNDAILKKLAARYGPANLVLI
ncbi:MAG: DNA polymerase III subunit alpha [Clostridiaceae bacterium]|nr:DNA polymerase III subunit alpha [Clostridiaceae bacterium]